jgi:hypothetical protein
MARRERQLHASGIKPMVWNDFREVEPGYILGTLAVFGVLHHMEYIRVVDDENGLQSAWIDESEGAENNNISRFEDMQQASEGRYCTLQLPGFEGEWVCHVTPYTM